MLHKLRMLLRLFMRLLRMVTLLYGLLHGMLLLDCFLDVHLTHGGAERGIGWLVSEVLHDLHVWVHIRHHVRL